MSKRTKAKRAKARKKSRGRTANPYPNGRTWKDELEQLPVKAEPPFAVGLSNGSTHLVLALSCRGAGIGIDVGDNHFDPSMSRREIAEAVRRSKTIGVVKLFREVKGAAPLELFLDADGIAGMRTLLKELAREMKEREEEKANVSEDTYEPIPKVQYAAEPGETVH